MSRHVLLNNIDHKDLRIITERSAKFGDDIMCAMVFPVEFRTLLEEYPIVFHRHPDTDEIVPVALFGIEQNENLFLDNGIWQASYIPMIMQRDPFLIGQQSRPDQPSEPPQMVIHVDMDSPRVSTREGQHVFLPHGGNSEFIENIAAMLKAIHFGQQENKAFADALKQHQLLEPFVVDIELQKNRQHRLSGFHTINEQTLRTLSDQEIAALHRQGFLPLIYAALFSLSKLNTLIARKQQRLTAKAG